MTITQILTSGNPDVSYNGFKLEKLFRQIRQLRHQVDQLRAEVIIKSPWK